MLHGIKYNIDKITDQSGLVLATLGGEKLLYPVLENVIRYMNGCGVPRLETDFQIEELWRRMGHLRRHEIRFYSNPDGSHHPFEPYKADLYRYRNVYIDDLNERPLNQWLNMNQSLFKEQNRKICEAEGAIKPNAAMLKLREEWAVHYIQEQMEIKHVDIGLPKQQPQQNKPLPHQNPNQPFQPKQNVPDLDQPVLDKDGNPIPAEILKSHREFVIKTAIQKRKKRLPLNDEEQQLLTKHDEEQLLKQSAEGVTAPLDETPLADKKQPPVKNTAQPVKKPVKTTKKGKKR